MTADTSMATIRSPSLKGESRTPVAVSVQKIARTAPARTKSLQFLRKAGKGLLRENSRWTNFPMVPIGQTEHQNLAKKKVLMISSGHPKAQSNSVAGFLAGSPVPRNRNIIVINKKGIAAL